MELKNYITKFNIQTIEQLKLNINALNIKYKELSDNGELLLLLYHDYNTIIDDNDEYKDLKYTLDGLIINDKLDIVCYNFNKEYLTLQSLNKNELYYEPSLEGTLIRLYYYNSKWNMATKRCIDAKKSYWTNKSFYELFGETNFIEIQKILNKQYYYSFILIHPDNSMVIKYNNVELFHIGTRDSVTLMEVDDTLNHKVIKKNRKVKINDDVHLNSIIKELNERKDIKFEGYLFSDNNNNRCKIEYEHYRYLKSLWGNVSNRFIRFFEMSEQETDRYLMAFPHHLKLYESYQYKLNIMVNQIYNEYVEKHVKKNKNIILTTEYKSIIYDLHGDYLRTHSKITIEKVKEKLKTHKITMLKVFVNRPKKII